MRQTQSPHRKETKCWKQFGIITSRTVLLASGLLTLSCWTDYAVGNGGEGIT